jgi:hypothetical protein
MRIVSIGFYLVLFVALVVLGLVLVWAAYVNPHGQNDTGPGTRLYYVAAITFLAAGKLFAAKIRPIFSSATKVDVSRIEDR